MNRLLGTRRSNVLACLLPWLLAAPLLAQENGNPPGRAARLSVIEGNISFQPSGENDWSQATLNYSMTTGDRIYTQDGSRAELEVGPWAVRLAQDTDLTLANLTDQFMQLGVGQGSVRIAVYQMPSGNTVEIDTPNGALTAYGPGSYRVDVDPNNGTRVIVNRGSLQVTGVGPATESARYSTSQKGKWVSGRAFAQALLGGGEPSHCSPVSSRCRMK